MILSGLLVYIPNSFLNQTDHCLTFLDLVFLATEILQSRIIVIFKFKKLMRLLFHSGIVQNQIFTLMTLFSVKIFNIFWLLLPTHFLAFAKNFFFEGTTAALPFAETKLFPQIFPSFTLLQLFLLLQH